MCMLLLIWLIMLYGVRSKSVNWADRSTPKQTEIQKQTRSEVDKNVKADKISVEGKWQIWKRFKQQSHKGHCW